MTNQNRTINDSITDIINDTLKTQPYPTQCTITRTYTNEPNRVDINTPTYGRLSYIQTITEHEVGDETILIFLNNTYEEKIVI